MRLGSKIRRQNSCNIGLMISKRYWQSSISNQKTSTTRTKAGLQLVRRKQEDVLSTLEFVNNSKKSLGRQEWVSVLECVCADGSVGPLQVIFKAENLSTQRIIHGHRRFSC